MRGNYAFTTDPIGLPVIWDAEWIAKQGFVMRSSILGTFSELYHVRSYVGGPKEEFVASFDEPINYVAVQKAITAHKVAERLKS